MLFDWSKMYIFQFWRMSMGNIFQSAESRLNSLDKLYEESNCVMNWTRFE